MSDVCVGKRIRVDWITLMIGLNIPEVIEDFFEFQTHLYKGKSLSCQRCAYYALKKHYSTTTIAELLDKIFQDDCYSDNLVADLTLDCSKEFYK